MNDKELTLLAAKASGICHPGGEHSRHNDGRVWDCNRMAWWNPLHDDGDACGLRELLGLPHGSRREIVTAAAEKAKGAQA